MVMVPEAIIQRRLTYEDYQALPDDADYEIVEGVLYVAPSPRPRHQIIAYRLGYVLTGHSEGSGLGTVVPDADLIVRPGDIYVSPDLMFFRRERYTLIDPDEPITVIPDLVVEVLSPGSDRYDRVTKRQLYARLGVPHYWVADPSHRAITEHTLQPEGSYDERTVRVPEVFRPRLLPDLVIDLEQAFAG